MICTGPLFTPPQLTRRLAPAASVYGLFEGSPFTRQPLIIGCPPIERVTVAVALLTFPKRSWVSKSTLLYQGSQYMLSNCPSGSAIISEKLAGTWLTV